MAEKLETIKIKLKSDGTRSMIINKTDFDSSIHDYYESGAGVSAPDPSKADKSDEEGSGVVSKSIKSFKRVIKGKSADVNNSAGLSSNKSSSLDSSNSHGSDVNNSTVNNDDVNSTTSDPNSDDGVFKKDDS